MADETSEWIRLQQSKYDKTSRVLFHGRQLDVNISPYDIPVAARVRPLKERKLLSLELQYIGDEKTVKCVGDIKFLTPHIGKNSHRLYRLDFDMDQLLRQASPNESRSQALVKALKSFVAANSQLSRHGNYTVVEDVIANTPNLLPA